jgi:hypothetical protein
LSLRRASCGGGSGDRRDDCRADHQYGGEHGEAQD